MIIALYSIVTVIPLYYLFFVQYQQLWPLPKITVCFQMLVTFSRWFFRWTWKIISKTWLTFGNTLYLTDIINNCDLFFIAHFFTMCPSSPRFVFIIPTCALNRIKPHPSTHSIIYNIMLLFIYYYLLGPWAKFAIRDFIHT